MADDKQDILAGWTFDPARYRGHTAGPWASHPKQHCNGEFWCSIGTADGFGPITDIVGEEGNKARFYQPIAGMKYLVTPVPEQKSNAELIADAPSLLALCERQAGEIERLRGALEACQEFWTNGTPVAAGSLVAIEARAALKGGR